MLKIVFIALQLVHALLVFEGRKVFLNFDFLLHSVVSHFDSLVPLEVHWDITCFGMLRVLLMLGLGPQLVPFQLFEVLERRHFGPEACWLPLRAQRAAKCVVNDGKFRRLLVFLGAHDDVRVRWGHVCWEPLQLLFLLGLENSALRRELSLLLEVRRLFLVSEAVAEGRNRGRFLWTANVIWGRWRRRLSVSFLGLHGTLHFLLYLFKVLRCYLELLCLLKMLLLDTR